MSVRTAALLSAATLVVVSLAPIATASTGDTPESAARQGGRTSVENPFEPGDVCRQGHTGYYWTIDDWFAGNEAYRVYCDPVDCSGCEGGWKPLSVSMYLYWEEENSCELTVEVELREADTSDPGRPHPGRTIAVSPPTNVGPFDPPGLWAVTVALPPDCGTVAGPCFATIRFLDTCGDVPAIVADPGPCAEWRSWSDDGGGWIDLCGKGLKGNLSANVAFECQRPGSEESLAWTTVKSRYGSNE